MRSLNVLLLFLLAGCAAAPGPGPMAKAIADLDALQARIQIGDAQEQVLALLDPVNNKYKLAGGGSRPPDRYRAADGSLIAIHYFRSYWYPDGLLTDDELTPYTFRDGVLVSIGWVALGGFKATAKAAPAPIIVPAPRVIIRPSPPIYIPTHY